MFTPSTLTVRYETVAVLATLGATLAAAGAAWADSDSTMAAAQRLAWQNLLMKTLLEWTNERTRRAGGQDPERSARDRESGKAGSGTKTKRTGRQRLAVAGTCRSRKSSIRVATSSP